MSEATIALPAHKCGLCIEHNQHRNDYQTVAAWLEDREALGTGPNWVSAEERQRAIDTGEVWEIQWYPQTPVGFYHVAASTLAAALKAATSEGPNEVHFLEPTP